MFLERDAQDLLGGLIGGVEAAFLVEGEDAAGQTLEHRLQVSTLLFELALALPGGVPGPRELPGHFIEGCDEKSDLVLARGRQAGLVVAGGHRPGAERYIAQRCDDPPRREQGYPHRGEQAQHQHQ